MKIKLSLLTVTILFFGIGCDLQQANHETYGKVAEAVNTQKLISQKAGAGIVYKLSYDQVTIRTCSK